MAYDPKILTGFLDTAGGLYDLFGSGAMSIRGAANAGASAADPFASQRPQYQGMLSSLATDPSSFKLSPAAQAQMDTGLTNVARQGAAQGFLGSGNIMGALQKYSQQLAGQDYWKQMEMLAGLSGANVGSPAQAGVIRSGVPGQAGQAAKGIGAGAGQLGNIFSGFSKLGGGISSLWDYFKSPTTYDPGDMPIGDASDMVPDSTGFDIFGGSYDPVTDFGSDIDLGAFSEGIDLGDLGNFTSFDW